MTNLVKLLCLVLIVVHFIGMDASAYASGNRTKKSSSLYPVQVKAGWNMLSVPVNVADGRKGVLYPTSSSQAYRYDHGYIPTDSLACGTGFWLKFSSTQTIFIDGDSVPERLIDVRKGWNMIGSISVPVAVNMIISEPSNIVSGQCYGYVPGGGYLQADTI